MEHLKLLFVDDEEELVSAVVERLELRALRERELDRLGLQGPAPQLLGDRSVRGHALQRRRRLRARRLRVLALLLVLRHARRRRHGSFGGLLGRSQAMRQLFAVLERVAPERVTVLISGATSSLTNPSGLMRGTM